MAYEYIERNLREVNEELSDISHGRAVTLVAVTKSGTDDELIALCAAGATCIGENRPQELCRRADLLRASGYSPIMHQIGNLQRNKVRTVIQTASIIHTVDNLALAEEINKRAAAAGIIMPVLMEVNSASEPQKDGVLPERAEDLLLALRELPGLSVRGLMTMGPVCDGEQIRPYFRLTRELFDRLGDKYGWQGECILSMGMSDSYRIAIEEGSTLVRIGRRLFTK
jgi:pyridoxal phosphate enzyme (YggS family)